MTPRAVALPPAERRVAVVRVALDLVRERGTMPTTREIAEAAGIAEGTIFRAFDTKERLVEAVVGEAFCPASGAAQLSAVDPGLPLRDRLVEMVTVLQHRFQDIFGVMSALGLTAPPENREEHHGCRPGTGHVPPEDQDPADENYWHPGRIIGIVEPDAHQLTCTPAELVTYLRLFTFSASHPGISGGNVLPPETIVDVVLTGVQKPAPRIPRSSQNTSPRSTSPRRKGA